MRDVIAVSAVSERKYYEMKTRIITGAISGALFLAVLLMPWSIVLTVATSLIAVIAVYEIFSVTGMLKHKGTESMAIVFAFIAPFFTRMSSLAVLLTCVAYVILSVVSVALYRKEVPMKRMGVTYFLSLVVTLSFSCMSYLRTVAQRDSDGLFYVILALMMAWVCDTGAYFTGTFFGKHKLCPKLSPKKTVEGLVGGIACSLVFSVLAAICYQSWFLNGEAQVSYGGILLLVLVCAPLSVVGDLFASLIKRICGVKDFGKLFPGHGGVMDRFDSLLFVFPVVYYTAQVLPLIF